MTRVQIDVNIELNNVRTEVDSNANVAKRRFSYSGVGMESILTGLNSCFVKLPLIIYSWSLLLIGLRCKVILLVPAERINSEPFMQFLAQWFGEDIGNLIFRLDPMGTNDVLVVLQSLKYQYCMLECLVLGST